MSTMPAFPSIKETKTLEKKVKNLQRQQHAQTMASEYDDLNDLSDDDSYSSSASSSLDGFVVRDPRRHHDDDSSVQDLGGSSDEEEEEDYSSSSGVSGSIHSDDDEEAEEEEAATRKRLHKKRKLDVAPMATPVPAKEPRLTPHFNATKQRATETARLESLNNKVTLQLQELERVNATILENIKIAEDATALLEKKEAARTEEALFVLNHEKLKKDIETREANLRRGEEQLVANQAELQLTIVTAHQLENQLVARANALATEEAALAKEKEALAALPKPKPLPLPLPLPMTPLDGFISEMKKSNQNMISRDDMSAIVPTNLMCGLAYLGGKQQLKYHSVTNSQFLIVEVTSVETGQPLLRQIVAKQLYNAK